MPTHKMILEEKNEQGEKMSRQTPYKMDILSGRASRDYACGLMRGDTIATSETLSNMFGFFKVMRP